MTTFYLFITGQHSEYDETKIVEEIKIAETGYEAAPQAVMQLYLAFSMAPDEIGLTGDQLIKGKQRFSVCLAFKT